MFTLMPVEIQFLRIKYKGATDVEGNWTAATGGKL